MLATDGTETHAIFLYADGMIQWTTGDNDGGVNGLGGTAAQVGFNRGDGVNFAAIPASRRADLINLPSTTNVGVPGVWIFRISDDMIPTTYSKQCTQ